MMSTRAMKVLIALVALVALVQAEFTAVPLLSRSRTNVRRRRTDTGATLIGCSRTDFSVPVTIGSGNAAQTFEMIVDTGSATMAVAANGCCGVSPTYTTSLHSSNGAHNYGVSVGSSYADGSSWSGTIWADNVDVAGVTAVNMKIAVQTSANGFYLPDCNGNNPGYAQGIIGMAYSQLAMVGSNGMATDGFPNAVEASALSGTCAANVLSGTGVTGQSFGGLVFALNLCDEGGNMYFGPVDSTLYNGAATAAPVYVPVTQQLWYAISLHSMAIGSTTLNGNFGTTVVDSGTTQLIVPQSVYNGIVSAAQSNSAFVSALGANFFAAGSCVASSMSVAQLNAALPQLKFNLDNNVQLVVPAVSSYLNLYTYYGSTYICPGMVAGNGITILGWSVMNNFLVVFDRTTAHGPIGAIGFAPSTACDGAVRGHVGTY